MVSQRFAHGARTVVRLSAVIATPRRPETVEFSDERLAEPARVARKWTEDGLQGSVSHRLGKLVEMAGTLSRNLDLVHTATSEVVP